jgi:hypothetical protein
MNATADTGGGEERALIELQDEAHLARAPLVVAIMRSPFGLTLTIHAFPPKDDSVTDAVATVHLDYIANGLRLLAWAEAPGVQAERHSSGGGGPTHEIVLLADVARSVRAAMGQRRRSARMHCAVRRSPFSEIWKERLHEFCSRRRPPARAPSRATDRATAGL